MVTLMLQGGQTTVRSRSAQDQQIMITLMLQGDQVSAGILFKNVRHISTVTTATSSPVKSQNMSAAAKHTAFDCRNREVP
jgi:hypothetical protein